MAKTDIKKLTEKLTKTMVDVLTNYAVGEFSMPGTTGDISVGIRRRKDKIVVTLGLDYHEAKDDNDRDREREIVYEFSAKVVSDKMVRM